MDDSVQRVHYRACHLCEAICGLAITTAGERIVSIKGDPEDPLSRGYLCPKAVALEDLHTDPDRLRRPLRRIGAGWEEIDWAEAFAIAVRGLDDVARRHGADAIGVYRGNPTVHNYGSMTHSNHFLKLLGTRQYYSATSVDQLPHHLVCLEMYGHQFLQPIPDIDRCDFFLALGYNPLASNGSIMTVPDFRGRVKALQQRGGRFVVIDPRRTESAAVADAHHFVRPGSDALLLFAMLATVFEEDLLRPSPALDRSRGIDRVREVVKAFPPERVASTTGIDAPAVRQLTRDFCRAGRAVCHGRMGLSTQAFGTLCQWAIQLLNLVSGNLDREGGALPTQPAALAPQRGDRQAGHFGRRRTRVSGLPSFSGEFPVAALAEEMLTPGEGQLHAFVTVAGNPVLSTPNGRRLDQALAGLEFMVSVDPYLNETTRHADVILPPASPLAHEHYDIAFHRFAVRNTTRFNEAVFPVPAGEKRDWEIFIGLAEAWAELHGEAAPPTMKPEEMIDLALQSGAYGRAHELQLDLAALRAAPHGIDLGPLRPDLLERLATGDGLINAAPELFLQDVARLEATLSETPPPDTLSLIGRRHLRSNNSWMHNSHRLTKGPRRDRLLMHPDDLAARTIEDGARVRVSSRVGSVEIEVQATRDIMPGVVSLPHGFGHGRGDTRQRIADALPGVSANDLTDERFMDALSGNSALNGVPVTVSAVAPADA